MVALQQQGLAERVIFLILPVLRCKEQVAVEVGHLIPPLVLVALAVAERVRQLPQEQMEPQILVAVVVVQEVVAHQHHQEQAAQGSLSFVCLTPLRLHSLVA